MGAPRELRPGRRVERVIEMAVSSEQQRDRCRAPERREHARDFGHVGPLRRARPRQAAAPTEELGLRNPGDVAVGQHACGAELIVDVGDRHPRDVDGGGAGDLGPGGQPKRGRQRKRRNRHESVSTDEHRWRPHHTLVSRVPGPGCVRSFGQVLRCSVQSSPDTGLSDLTAHQGRTSDPGPRTKDRPILARCPCVSCCVASTAASGSPRQSVGARTLSKSQ